jgi:predicted transcriptional regulator
MERTQIYLTPEQQKAIESIAERREQTKSAIIREAIDRYIVDYDQDTWQIVLDETFGAWADMPESEVPDIRALREEWNERESRLWSHDTSSTPIS